MYNVRTGVPSLALRLEAGEEAGTRVHHLGLLDHEPILHQLPLIVDSYTYTR
jgi:hypothetical protein